MHGTGKTVFNMVRRRRMRKPRKSRTRSRTVSLPDDADPERVEARYHDGVLSLRIPRHAQPRRIEVQAG